MSEHFHALVWMDHQQAKVFRFNATQAEEVKLHTHLSGHHLQHKANTTGSGHKSVDKDYYAQIIAAMPATTPKNGFSWNLNFMNDNTGQTVTFAAGANVTLNATTATIATNTSRNFLVNVNINAGTVTIVGIGGGAAL